MFRRTPAATLLSAGLVVVLGLAGCRGQDAQGLRPGFLNRTASADAGTSRSSAAGPARSAQQSRPPAARIPVAPAPPAGDYGPTYLPLSGTLGLEFHDPAETFAQPAVLDPPLQAACGPRGGAASSAASPPEGVAMHQRRGSRTGSPQVGWDVNPVTLGRPEPVETLADRTRVGWSVPREPVIELPPPRVGRLHPVP